MTTSELSPTERSTVRRGKNRAAGERAALYRVLDAGLICQLGFVVDGAPVVLPTGYGRAGDTLYLHGSTGARSLRAAAQGLQVCVNVTLLDGVVYARSVFHHSVNYRSAVIHGRAVALTEPPDKLAALRVFTEHLAPGSWDYARRPNRQELARTAVLALDLAESAVKIRTGGPVDDQDDVAAGAAWAGVLPLRREWAAPLPCAELAPGVTVPAHVAARVGSG